MLPPPEEEEEEAAEVSKVIADESQPSIVASAKDKALPKDKKASVASLDKKEPPKKGGAKEEPKAEEQPAEGEEEEEDKEEDKEPKFEANDYLEKAEMLPPQDPYGNQTMVPDLLVAHAKILKILEDALVKTMTWLMTEKEVYNQKVLAEGKDLQDKSVEELD